MTPRTCYWEVRDRVRAARDSIACAEKARIGRFLKHWRARHTEELLHATLLLVSAQEWREKARAHREP